MASISNTVLRDPLAGAKRTAASPFSLASGTAPAKPLQNPFNSQKTAAMMPPPAVQPAPARSSGGSSATQQQKQVPGLLSPDLNSLSSSLMNISSGLANLQKQKQQAAPPQQQQTPTYPGLITDIEGASAPNSTQKGLVQNISDTARGNEAIGNKAGQISDKYGAEIARLGGLEAGAMTGMGLTAPVAMGRGNLAAQSASARIAALSAAQDAALKGTGQQLTGQQQTASAQAAALGGANTQQQQQLGGLGSAAGLAAPQFGQPGQVGYDPLNPGAGNAGFDASLEQYAQMAAKNQMSAIPASITGNSVLNAKILARAKEINPGFTPASARGAEEVLGGLPALKSAETAADGIKNTIITYLNQNPQINSTDAALANQFQQWVEGRQLTDARYQILFNNLDEYTNTLAPILGVGGAPTNLKTEIAQSFLNPSASGKSITQVLEAMNSLAKNKITDIERGAGGQGTSVPAPTRTQGYSWDNLFD